MDEGAVPVIMQPATWKNIWAWPEATALAVATLNTRWCCCFCPFPGFRGFSAHWRFQQLACVHIMDIFLPSAVLFSGTSESMKDEKWAAKPFNSLPIIINRRGGEEIPLYNLSNYLLNVSGHDIKAYGWLFLVGAGLFLTWRISCLLCNLCLQHRVLLCLSYPDSFKRRSPSQGWAAICFCLLGQLGSS